MSCFTSEAYILASEIERVHAADRARLRASDRRGPRLSFKQRAAAEYDPHAATELAELIIFRLAPLKDPAA